jgi:hypothetical protein
VTSPNFEPVPVGWARAAGIVLLVAAAGITAVLGYALLDATVHAGSRGPVTSSTLVFALILTALGGICWQAGYRLTFGRGRQGSLFSRPAWFAIGIALIVIAALMATVIASARAPTLLDWQVVLTLGVTGAWCIVLARRAHP